MHPEGGMPLHCRTLWFILLFVRLLLSICGGVTVSLNSAFMQVALLQVPSNETDRPNWKAAMDDVAAMWIAAVQRVEKQVRS